MKLTITTDTKTLVKYVEGLINRDIVNIAVNETLDEDVAQAQQDEMKRVFDMPTPYTINAIRLLSKARKRKELGFPRVKRFNAHYLIRQIEGGNTRNRKGLEVGLTALRLIRSTDYVIPHKAAPGYIFDKYKNVKGSFVVKYLAWARKNPKAVRRRRTLMYNKDRVFFVIPSLKYAPLYAFDRVSYESFEQGIMPRINRLLGQ